MIVIGIDFSTASNKIGCFDKYGLRILTNNYKDTSTPSVAFFRNLDKWVFGEKAVKLGIDKANKMIFDAKVMIGRPFDDSLIQSKLNYWPFKIKNNQNDIKILIKIDNKTYEFYPYEILGLIFKNLLQITKINNFSEKSQIIISIPAIFNKNQINDLSKAARFAQFNNFDFRSEPILASLAYLYHSNIDLTKNYNILIYDLGSSHLDVSIIQIHDETYEIYTEQGEINGKQFDDNIYYYVKEQMCKNYKQKIEYLERPKTNSILQQKCEEAKIFLSEIDEVEITLGDENQLSLTLTLEKFNEINSKLFERSMKPVKKVIEKAGISKESIDDVFFVGGSTFIKKIRKLLFNTIKKVPCPTVDPREAVAIGACIAGAWLLKDDSESQIHCNFNKAIEILMSKSPKNDEMKNPSNSEENDHISKEKILQQSTENKNHCSLEQNKLSNSKEIDSSESEINYFWFNKNKKQKQNQNENKNDLSSKNLKNFQSPIKNELNNSQNSPVKNNSPKENVLSEPKETDSPKEKFNYFWFNENTSPVSKTSKESLKPKENENPINQNDSLKSNEKQNESKQNKLCNSNEKDDISNSNENHSPYKLNWLSDSDLSKSGEDHDSFKQNDSFNLDEFNFFENENTEQNKGVPLYVCLTAENDKNKQEIIEKSCQDDSLDSSKKIHSPKKAHQNETKSSPHNPNSAIQSHKSSHKSEKNPKDYEKEDTSISKKSPRKTKKDELYNQDETKFSYFTNSNKSQQKSNLNYNYFLEKDTNSNSKQNTPTKSNKNESYNQKYSMNETIFSLLNNSNKNQQKSNPNYNYFSEKDTNSNSKQNTPIKSNKNEQCNQKESEQNNEKRKSKTKRNKPKVSIYPNLQKEFNTNYESKSEPRSNYQPDTKNYLETKYKPLKKTNFNIYQNSQIPSSNQDEFNYRRNSSNSQKKSDNSQKSSICDKPQNQSKTIHPKTSNSKKIFFKIHT